MAYSRAGRRAPLRLRTVTLDRRPALRRQFQRLHAAAWPAFLNDVPVNALWPRLYTEFPAFQLALVDARGRAVAVGNTVPFVWDGRPRALPDRIVDVLRRAVADRARGRRPTVLSALAVVVDRAHRGRGLSARVVRAMAALAAARGLRALVAPVRPSGKGAYPLTPMDEYARWRTPEGRVFDPWLRVHVDLGARVLRVTPRGNTTRGTVREWETTTGLRFPVSGRYVVPGAFQPIAVDRTRDHVLYEEPNVWMRHPVPGRGTRRHRARGPAGQERAATSRRRSSSRPASRSRE